VTDNGLDYSFGRPNLDIAWAQGFRFVARYLSWLPNSKVINPGELSALRAKGFHVALNWEFDAKDALGGAEAGHTQATEAVRQAKSLGYPAGCTIYYSVDFDEAPDQAPTVAQYFQAAGSVTHAGGFRIGAYGGFYVIQRLFDAKLIDDGWQTYAWSGGQWDPRATVRQVHNGVTVGGADTDLNTRLGATHFMGQATPPTPPPPPQPHPVLHRPWPSYMQPGNFFGLITGPSVSHGGFFPNERPDVEAIQQRLIQLGFVPGVTNIHSGWADGKFEQQTRDAVARWQRARYAAQTTRYGEVWQDDWARLFTF
jgi:hypothetical protein